MKIMFTFDRNLQLSKSKMFYSHKMRNQKRYFATKVTHREVKQNVTTTWVIYIIYQEFYSLYDTPSWGRHGRDRMVVLIYNYLSDQCLSPPTLWVWIPLMAWVLDTTIMRWGLLVTCDRALVFSEYSDFLHQ